MGGKYRADPATTVVATQTAYPWRAVLRSIVQNGIPTFLAFAVLVPEIVEAILAQFGEVMPESWRVKLLAVAAGITGVAAVITRIMALPRFVEFTRKHASWLAPDDRKKSAPVVAG